MLILVLVIGMILTFVAGYQIAEKSILSPRPKVEELVKSALSEPDYYNCAVSTERMFEMRLVEAEVMGLEDMAVCEDYKCKNCEPSRNRTTAIRRAKQRAEAEMKDALTRQERSKNMLEAQNTPVRASAPIEYRGITADRIYPPRPPAGNGGGSPAPTSNRYKSIYGRRFPIPNNVPRRAEVYVVHDDIAKREDIMWTWTDDGSPNGKPMFVRQTVDAAFLNSLERAFDAKPYREGEIKECDEFTHTFEPESCFPCDDYTEIEVDQLLGQAVKVFTCGCGDCF